MKIFSSPSAAALDGMSTQEVRDRFLIDGLFSPGQLQLAYTDLDRLVVGGIVPVGELALPAFRELDAAFFTERREVGIINIGGPGDVLVGDRSYSLANLECLYVGTGEPDIRFRSGPDSQAEFYLLSAPAHRKLPVCKATLADATVHRIGKPESASSRKLVQYIHEGGIQSCQLVMGYTELAPGSVWNTWPPHTHLRRSEIYLYFDLDDNMLVHFLGEPSRSKHLIIRDRQAVLSPPWSIHCGVGTAAYRFIWGMAGENRTFADMDPADLGSFA